MTTETTTLADLCKTLRIAPKLARHRLRAAEYAHDGRYVFTKAQVAKVTAIIKGNGEAKAKPSPKAAKKAPAKKKANDDAQASA
jgi:hypothetical protein